MMVMMSWHEIFFFREEDPPTAKIIPGILLFAWYHKVYNTIGSNICKQLTQSYFRTQSYLWWPFRTLRKRSDWHLHGFFLSTFCYLSVLVCEFLHFFVFWSLYDKCIYPFLINKSTSDAQWMLNSWLALFRHSRSIQGVYQMPTTRSKLAGLLPASSHWMS